MQQIEVVQQIHDFLTFSHSRLVIEPRAN